MKQFETSVNTVMAFLHDEKFSAAVICQHKQCYQAILQYLSDNKLEYTPEIASQWINMHLELWNYRKYTGFRHCIDQLNDVIVSGEISLAHLSPRCSAYSLLSENYKSILDEFMLDTDRTDNSYRIACSRFLFYLQNDGIHNISELTYNTMINFHKNDYHKSQRSNDVYEDVIRVFLRYLASRNICDIGLSLVLNKLLINKVIIIPQEELQLLDNQDNEEFDISWPLVERFISELKSQRYGKCECQ